MVQSKCSKCKLFVSMTKDEVVQCKGSCESVYHRKCVQNSKFLQNQYCENCFKNTLEQSATASSSSKIAITTSEGTNEKVLLEINSKLEILYSVEKKLEDLKSHVEFYAEEYQCLIKYKEESQKKIKSLEQKNVFFEKCNKALEERVMELEMQSKAKNIEIHGLEMIPNENTTTNPLASCLLPFLSAVSSTRVSVGQVRTSSRQLAVYAHINIDLR
ncbi:hypothetical protein ACJJTC_014028 [Scirpophaga incertulas]